MKTYADVMFTPAVRAQQDRDGTGESYARRYANMDIAQLGPDEADFLGSRTSIYMASVSQTGWPYVQHRGGPAGFLKVLNGQTLGFADYRGNRQYISKGNLSHDNRVSLFAMDYARIVGGRDGPRDVGGFGHSCFHSGTPPCQVHGTNDRRPTRRRGRPSRPATGHSRWGARSLQGTGASSSAGRQP